MDEICNCFVENNKNNQLTVEATVSTGFEFLSMSECKEKLKSTNVIKTQGRIFFNTPYGSYDNVKSLRSIDNIYLLCGVFENLKLENNKELDLLKIKNLVNIVDWQKFITLWAEAVGLSNRILFPKREEEGSEDVLKFRVTCNRVGNFHKFSSMEAATCFGGFLQDTLLWTVNLKNFDIEIVLHINNENGYICLGLTNESLHRRNISHFGSTTLRSTMCYNMLRLAEPVTGDVIFDPLCGGGSISIEGILSYPDSYNICGDNDDQAIKRTHLNTKHIIKHNNQNYLIDTVKWNATNLPLRDSMADIIITDLPFGKRCGIKKNNIKLYENVLSEMARITRSESGRASILTSDKRSFTLALRQNNNYWKESKMFSINHGGMKAFVYLLLRTSTIFVK